MQKLIPDIIRYIEYLQNSCNLSISIHFDQSTLRSFPPQVLESLLPYNSHTNPYCMAVKKSDHTKCIINQREILKNESGSCLRVCHAGVCEYIHTVNKNSKRGFIAVSGYRQQNPPAGSSHRRLWENTLRTCEVPSHLLSAVIPPLAIMIEQLFGVCNNSSESEYNLIVQFLNEYHTNITLPDLCSHFGRSKSHISHMFKSASGMTLREYCNNLKLEDARKLLSATDLSVTEIAFDVGFNDASYFVHLFSKKYGITPLQYRKGMLPE